LTQLDVFYFRSQQGKRKEGERGEDHETWKMRVKDEKKRNWLEDESERRLEMIGTQGMAQKKANVENEHRDFLRREGEGFQ
jgi:hypothetical protein